MAETQGAGKMQNDNTRGYERPQVTRRESVQGVLGVKSGGGSFEHPRDNED
jgi:hypothetical protein